MRLLPVAILLLAVFAAVWSVTRRDAGTVGASINQTLGDTRHRLADGSVTERALISWPGGVARVRWYSSNSEPLSPKSHAAMTLLVDGKPMASAVKGAGTGIYEDGP